MEMAVQGLTLQSRTWQNALPPSWDHCIEYPLASNNNNYDDDDNNSKHLQYYYAPGSALSIACIFTHLLLTTTRRDRH